MEKGKEKSGKRVWGNVLAGGGMVPSCTESVSSLGSKVPDHGEPGRGRSTMWGCVSEVLGGWRDWTDTGDGNFLVQGGLEKVGAKGSRGN